MKNSSAAVEFSTASLSPSRSAWKESVRTAIRCGRELCRRLGLSEQFACERVEGDFAVFVPEPFFQRIQPGNPDDPLLKQVLGTAAEAGSSAGYSVDPVGDLASLIGPGVLHKYPGRALLIATGVCAVHCRYCFRRHFSYEEQTAVDLSAVVDSLREEPTIDEVLLSGGDPWMLTDERLAMLVEGLEQVEHLRRLRIHTRLPIVIPSRVTAELCELLRRSRLTPWVVVHVNHPAELDEATLESLGRLVDHGIPVMNQAVLLRGHQ